MSEALRWESQPPRLTLQGELDRETLVAFWDARKN